VRDIEFLLVRRYDRFVEGRIAKRIHQEDLCQAAGFPPYLKYEWNHNLSKGGPSAKSCMDVLDKTSAPGLNRLRFFELMLFSVLVGNVDAHSKNYSLIIRNRSTILLAPLYDVVNGEIYPNVTRNLAMKIAGKQRAWHIHGRHWDRFAEQNGLSATQVRKRVSELSAAVLKSAPETVEYMENEFGKNPVYKEIYGYVAETCRRMLVNLNTEPTVENEQAEIDDANPEDDKEISNSFSPS
jgi:serine/threonine-protein kinase HipA